MKKYNKKDRLVKIDQDKGLTAAEVKKMTKQDKIDFKNEVDNINNELYNGVGFKIKVKEYNQTKKMKWWTYLISLIISLIFTSIALILWKTTNLSVVNYFNYVLITCFIIILFILSLIKSRDAKNYFHDKRRGFQHTLTQKEAYNILSSKTIFLTIVLLLPELITFIILFS